MYLAIKNKGIVPINALELLGATTKEGDSTKVGMFGSGIKYAIAASLRNGIELVIVAGDWKITFKTVAETIGDVEVYRIVMVVNDDQEIFTSWTTKLGYKDWVTKEDEESTVEWKIVRECYCNALDEDGGDLESVRAIPGDVGEHTVVYIAMTTEVERIFRNLGSYITRDGHRAPICQTDYGDIYTKSGKKGRIYNKGIFVRSVPEDTIFDYDFNNLQLSESRSVDVWDVRWKIGYMIEHANKACLKRMMRKIADGGRYLERQIADHIRFGQTAADAFKEEFGQHCVVAPDNADKHMVAAVKGQGYNVCTMPEAWYSKLSAVTTGYLAAMDKYAAKGVEFIDEIKELDHDVRIGVIQKVAEVCSFFGYMDNYPNVRFYKMLRPPVAGSSMDGIHDGDFIGICINILGNKDRLAEVIIHEVGHWASGARDCTDEFVDFFVKAIARNI